MRIFLKPSRAVLIASLPYQVKGIVVGPEKREVQAGSIVTFRGSVAVSGGEVGHHGIEVRVINPRGEGVRL